jgi:hypothetical protein
VGASTIVCRRWGERVGGLLSAFPAVVGPVLLSLALERGAAFTAQAANGTLLGLAALAGFVLAYARAARHAGWGPSLLAGWACAGAIATALSFWGQRLEFPARLVAAAISLATAYRPLPSSPAWAVRVQTTPGRRDIPLWMAATAALVLALTSATELFGALIGGVLAALPVLASVLTAFTHRDQGASAAVALLRGMLIGMACFVGFCALVALLVVPVGVTVAFAAATVAAVARYAAVIFMPQAEAASSASASRT